MVSKPFVSDFAGPLRRPNAPPGTIPRGCHNMALRNKGFKQRQRPDSSHFCGVLPDRRTGYGTLCGRADFPGRPCGHMGGSQMQDIKYRLVNPGLRPRRTKLEMPGWGGQPAPRTDGSHEYAWHCAPFTESAQYGIEVFYPYENELHVSQKNGVLHFDGDFGEPPDDDLQWPPFRKFGSEYYTYQLLLDLKVGKDWAVRTEPHPRFYTETTGQETNT